MTTAKMETAAERYRRLRKDSEPLHDVTCPECSMTWKCRGAKREFWISSGMLPTELAAAMVNSTRKGPVSENEIVKNMTDKQFVQGIDFTNKMVKYTAVEPRIVETIEGPNDITQDEVMVCCYMMLKDWQMKGGDGAAVLDTFPKG